MPDGPRELKLLGMLPRLDVRTACYDRTCSASLSKYDDTKFQDWTLQ